MFTIQQIKEAHSKVKSGADFPQYVQDVIKLGVKKYESFVSDGHVLYYGSDDHQAQSDAKYPALTIADKSDKSQFQKELKEHQQGKTDYMTFCSICAQLGVEKWVVDTDKMTCTYYDKAGNELLVETIPAP
ncbi:DUF1398 domain-containing protein [Runella sp.]|uniref:DUF1398 domain-containing protein n=1 Tax=Runella sp. TaxID=1960881 RepID=UPI003D0EB34A